MIVFKSKSFFFTNLYICLSLFIVLNALIYFSFRAQYNLSININEAWNLNHALRLRSGEDLYPKIHELFVNNYPPLSFIISNFFYKIGLPPLISERFLSIVSTLNISILIFLIGRRLGNQTYSSFLGSIWYLQHTYCTAPYYVGTNDPSIFAVSIMCISIYFFVRFSQSHKIYISIVFQIFAGFIKHNLITIPIILFLAFIIKHIKNIKNVIYYFYISIFCLIIGFICSIYLFGFSLLEHLNFPRQIIWYRAFQGWENLPWDVMLLFGLSRIKNGRFIIYDKYFFVYGGAFILFLIQKTGAGVARNASFEFDVVSAIILIYLANSLEISFFNKISKLFITLLFFIKLSIGYSINQFSLIFQTEFRNDAIQRNLIANREIEKIGRMPGNVACSITLLCVLAGKGLQIDRFFIDQKLIQKFITEDQLKKIIVENNLYSIDNNPNAQWNRNF